MAQFRRQIQPARYVSQYDPAQEQLEMQAMLQRSQNFQESFGKLQEAEARQGSIFFLDPEARAKTLGQFEERKEEILEKHAGDFEAATPELTRLVTQEQRNPVYQLNKYQIQKQQEFQDMVNRVGPTNALIAKAPSKSLYDEKTGKLKNPENFEYEVYDKANLLKQTQQFVFPALKPKDSGLQRDTKTGWYKQVQEVTQEQADKIMDDESVKSYLEATPSVRRIAESQGLENEEEILNFAREFMRPVVENQIGEYNVKYHKPDYRKEKKTEIPESYRGGTMDWVNRENYSPDSTTKVSDLVEEGKKPLGADVKESIDKAASNQLSPFNKTVYEGIKKVKNLASQYFTEEARDVAYTPGDAIGIKDAVTAIKNLINTGKKEKLDEAEKLIINFAEKHPEAEGEIEDVAKMMDDVREQYSREYSKIHIPGTDFNAAESNFVFVDDGRVGNIFGRKITAYTPEGKEEFIGAEKSDKFYELITGKDSKNLSLDDKLSALKSANIQGITFTGTTPAALGVYTVDGIPLEIENTKPAKEIGATTWGLAEAIRTDNESELLDNLGPEYGIHKDGNFYTIPNKVQGLYEDYGITHFKVNNKINYNPELDRYEGEPFIQPYGEDGNLIRIEDANGNLRGFPLQQIIKYTYGDMISRELIKLKD